MDNLIIGGGAAGLMCAGREKSYRFRTECFICPESPDYWERAL